MSCPIHGLDAVVLLLEGEETVDVWLRMAVTSLLFESGNRRSCKQDGAVMGEPGSLPTNGSHWAGEGTPGIQ